MDVRLYLSLNSLRQIGIGKTKWKRPVKGTLLHHQVVSWTQFRNNSEFYCDFHFKCIVIWKLM